MAPGFADDGFFAGPSQDVLASLQRVASFMPRLGLRFLRLEAIPAAGQASSIVLQPFVDVGCTVNLTANVSVMRSPIGDVDYCEEQVANGWTRRLASWQPLPNCQINIAHCICYVTKSGAWIISYALHLLAASCARSLKRFDACVWGAYEAIVGFSASSAQWEQACLPTRHGGIGLRSVCKSADAAYYSSRAATWDRCEAIYPNYAGLMDDPVRQAETNINAAVREECHVPALPSDSHIPSQQQISHSLSAALAGNLRKLAEPFDRARLIAYSAPMVGRWMAATPSKTLDM